MGKKKYFTYQLIAGLELRKPAVPVSKIANTATFFFDNRHLNNIASYYSWFNFQLQFFKIQNLHKHPKPHFSLYLLHNAGKYCNIINIIQTKYAFRFWQFSYFFFSVAAHKLPTSSNTGKYYQSKFGSFKQFPKIVPDHNSIVLRKLNAIIRKLELVDGRLHSLTIKNLGIEDNAEFEETEGFLPIDDDEGLTNFEHRLKHETGFRTKMVRNTLCGLKKTAFHFIYFRSRC